MKKYVFLLSALIPFLLSACGSPQLPTGSKATPPGSGEGSKYQCKDVTGSTDPWLVEWDPTAKVRLQSKTKKGVLLVKYSGCNLEVLYGCEVEGQYDFTSTTRSSQTEYINNEDELFAKLPIGALNLAAEFNQGDRWSLDYVVVGTQDANVNQIKRTDLSGKCLEATHFIQGMAVGAYQLGAEAHLKGGAEASFGQAGLGGSSGSAAGKLRQDGRYEKCVGEETDATDQGCQAIVQLYLEPISGAVPIPKIECPVGSEYKDGRCVSTNSKVNCPSGSRFVAGQGCVGQAVAAPVSNAEPPPASTNSGRSDEVNQPGTNLNWLRCPVGQTWDGSGCSGSSKKMNWKVAKSACPSGYRLPTRQEFVGLLGGCDSKVLSGKTGNCNKCSASTNCDNMFPSDTDWYWSSSPNDLFGAWPASFNGSNVRMAYVIYDTYVRCVRSNTQPARTPTVASSARSDEVKQPGTNLYWLQCPVGQTWDGASCIGKAKRTGWKSAMTACPSGYRLPTVSEFSNLLGGCGRDDRAVSRTGLRGISSVQVCNSCAENKECSKILLPPNQTSWTSSTTESGDDAWVAGASYNLRGRYLLHPTFVGRRSAEIRCLRTQ